MATWIAHLRIAEALLELIPGLAADQFAIGNIAPHKLADLSGLYPLANGK